MIEEMEDLQETYPCVGTVRLHDNKVACDRLNRLVHSGHKTAEYNALAYYDNQPNAMPKVGRCDIATDRQDVSTLVICTNSVERIRIYDVSLGIAFATGENSDLDGWRKDRKAFFERNGGFEPQMMLLLEHFELVENLADH